MANLTDYEAPEQEHTLTRCPRCEKELPASEFWKDKRRSSGLQTYCKTCTYDFRRTNPNTKAVARRWYHHKGKYVANARRYGLTVDEYKVLIETATCSVCDAEPGIPTVDGHTAMPYVDHDHRSGKVRGVLCPRCNSGIGLFRDDVELLRRAIAYLESHL